MVGNQTQKQSVHIIIYWDEGEIGPICDFWRIWYRIGANAIVTNCNIITVDTIEKEVIINMDTCNVDINKSKSISH